MSSRAILLVGLVHSMAGCFLEHGRDHRATDEAADASPDALEPVRADRDGVRDASIDADAPMDGGMSIDADVADAGVVRRRVYWSLEPAREVMLRALPVGDGECAQSETVLVEVSQYLNSQCEHGGPVELVFDAENHRYVVRSWIWVEHSTIGDDVDCPGITYLSSRIVPVTGLEETVTVVHESSGVSILLQGRDPEVECTRELFAGDNCAATCQCQPGLVCHQQYVDCNRVATCVDLCNQESLAGGEAVYGMDMDCPSGYGCARSDLGIHVCLRRGDHECRDGVGCPNGFQCIEGDTLNECEWDWSELLPFGQPCDDDLDCPLALHCVQGTGGSRACEVPCFTNEMRCPRELGCLPFPHTSSAAWVCQDAGRR